MHRNTGTNAHKHTNTYTNAHTQSYAHKHTHTNTHTRLILDSAKEEKHVAFVFLRLTHFITVPYFSL